MKFAAIATFASMASGAALQQRQRTENQIVNFSASCIPHSVMCSYSFDVIGDPSLPSSHCSAMVQGPDYLPAVQDASCEDNAAYNWSVDKVENGGLDFKLWYAFNARSNITFCHGISAAEIVVEDNGSVQDERYVGPANFTISALDC